MRQWLVLSLLLVSSFSFAQITYSSAKFGANMFSNSVAIGDFDRDGHLDVASMDGADGLLTIFHGGSGGSLTQTVQYQVPANLSPAFVQTADLNGDGILDLIISKEFTPELEIWYGNGNATFALNQVLQINTPSPDFALGDVNGDGSVDIITSQSDDTSAQVVVYVNGGHGTFTKGTTIDASVNRIQRFATGDFNRDGKLDVLLSSGTALLMYPGKGDGTFGAPVSSPITGSQGSIVVGSFNHDSNLDVALRTIACNTCNNDKILIYLNNGSGHFTLATTVFAGKGSGSDGMAAGDLNNDGVMDLVIANRAAGADATTNPVQYLLNDGTGHFGAAQTVIATSLAPWLPVLRHFNRDSQLDILVPAESVYRFLATNAPTNCTPPSPANLSGHICTPAASTTISRTFTVRAAGDSPAGVVRMELWVDGKKVFENWGDQLKRTITLAAGVHRVTIHSIDRYKGFGSATETITAK